MQTPPANKQSLWNVVVALQGDLFRDALKVERRGSEYNLTNIVTRTLRRPAVVALDYEYVMQRGLISS